jgi:hypothetical protein
MELLFRQDFQILPDLDTVIREVVQFSNFFHGRFILAGDAKQGIAFYYGVVDKITCRGGLL